MRVTKENDRSAYLVCPLEVPDWCDSSGNLWTFCYKFQLIINILCKQDFILIWYYLSNNSPLNIINLTLFFSCDNSPFILYSSEKCIIIILHFISPARHWHLYNFLYFNFCLCLKDHNYFLCTSLSITDN